MPYSPKEAGIRFKMAGIEARLQWEFIPSGAMTGAGAGAAFGSLPAAILGMEAGLEPAATADIQHPVTLTAVLRLL